MLGDQYNFIQREIKIALHFYLNLNILSKLAFKSSSMHLCEPKFFDTS